MKGKGIIWNTANLITLARLILLFIAVYLLFQDLASRIAASFLIFLVLFLDLADGYVARKFHSNSKFGSVLDIAVDRIVENVLWLVFAYLRLIPLWVPLVVITRGFLTDFARSCALSEGMTAFGKRTMIKDSFGKLLVSSEISRFGYASFKAISFVSLSILLIIKESFGYWAMLPLFYRITYGVVLITVAWCIIRAIPVIYNGLKLFFNKKETKSKS